MFAIQVLPARVAAAVIAAFLAFSVMSCSQTNSSSPDATRSGTAAQSSGGGASSPNGDGDGFPSEYRCADTDLAQNLTLPELQAATEAIRAELEREAPDTQRYVPHAEQVLYIDARIPETPPGGQAAFAEAACQSLTALSQSSLTPLSFRPLKLNMTGSAVVYGYHNFCIFDKSEMESQTAPELPADAAQALLQRIEADYDASTPDGYRNRQLFVHQVMLGAYMGPTRTAAFQKLCPQLNRTVTDSPTPAELREKLGALSEPPPGACGAVELATPLGPLNGYLNVEGTPVEGLRQSGVPSCELAREIFARAAPKDVRANGLDIADDFWQCYNKEETPRIINCDNANGYSWLAWEIFAL